MICLLNKLKCITILLLHTMQITTPNGTYEIFFDIYGNLYFKNDKVYCLEINGRSEPTLEETTFSNSSIINIPTKKFEIISSSLKQLVSDEIDNLDEDNEEEEPDYYPEDSNIITNADENTDDDPYDMNVDETFEFGSKNNNENVAVVSYEDGIYALYDTYIYHEDALQYKTNYVANVPALYRLRLYTNGTLYIRPIGYPEKSYKIDDLIMPS